MDATSPLCFTCGQESSSGTKLNRLDDGRVCPACAQRLMQALPSLLPGQPADQSEEEPAEVVSGEPAPLLQLVDDPPAPEREGA